MTRNYSRNTFLRQTPNKALKEYFASKGLLTDIDFDALRETESEPIAAALEALGEKQRTAVEAEFRPVNEMASETGVQVLIEEARYPFHDVDWSEPFSRMKNHYERALWAFMNHPDVFRVASEWAYMDRLGGWRQRYVGEGRTPATGEEDKENLADAICAFYAKQGRGRHCKVDNYLRESPERHCYFAYPEDYATTQIGYDGGRFHHWPVRPAFEVVFVYRPDTGFLEISAKGKGEEAQKLQEIFCQTILGLQDLPDKRSKYYDLALLKNRGIRFHTDPADGVEGVSVKMLRFDMPGTSHRRITFEANSSGDDKAIYTLIDKTVAKQNLPLDDIVVGKAKLQFKFAGRDGKRGKSLTFEISIPDRCTLKDDPLDQIAKKYIERWGFIHGWAPDTVGQKAARS